VKDGSGALYDFEAKTMQNNLTRQTNGEGAKHKTP
jgi:hypothetical protein